MMYYILLCSVLNKLSNSTIDNTIGWVVAENELTKVYTHYNVLGYGQLEVEHKLFHEESSDGDVLYIAS